MASFDGSTDAPTLTLEVNPSALSTFIIGQSLLGGTAELGESESWTAVPMTDVWQIAIRRGRTREDQPVDAGTMTVLLDNLSGYYDPDNSSPSNPYTLSSESWWRLAIPARLRATWSAVTYGLFKGKLEDPVADLGADPTVTFTFVDGIAQASARDTSALTLAAETTGQRAGRALDLMGWPSADRVISGSRNLLAQTEASTVTGVLEECAKAEGGRFYVDVDGSMRLTNRADALSRTVDLVLADDDTSGSADYAQLTTSPGVKYVVNKATVTNGTYSASSSDDASVAKHGPRSDQPITVPLADSADIDSLAIYRAHHRSTASTRVEQVSVEALKVGSAWAGLLSVDLGDRVQVKRTGSNGVGLNVVCAVEGIEHTISARNWRITFYTAPIDTTGLSFIVGSSLLGGADVLGT
jgi:hypothetical protein